MILIKRAYDNPEKSDGYRVLVDRIWPRGISKEKEQLDDWFKDIAPSTELRKWFNHDKEKFPLFKEKYINELKENKKLVLQLMKVVKEHNTTTFVYAAKNEKCNNAVVLKEFIESM